MIRVNLQKSPAIRGQASDCGFRRGQGVDKTPVFHKKETKKEPSAETEGSRNAWYALLGRFLNRHGQRNRRANHGVVAHAILGI